MAQNGADLVYFSGGRLKSRMEQFVSTIEERVMSICFTRGSYMCTSAIHNRATKCIAAAGGIFRQLSLSTD